MKKQATKNQKAITNNEEFNKREQEIIKQIEEEKSYFEEGENPEIEFNDRHQGVLFLSYGEPLKLFDFFKELRDKNIGVRVLIPFEVTFNCYPNKKYNEQVNYFKHFTTCQNKDLIDEIKKNYFLKKAIEKFLSLKHFKLMDYELWETDTTHKYLNLGLTPVAVEHKEEYRNLLKDEQHKKNYDNLVKFKSEGYKKVNDALFKDKTPETKEIKDSNKPVYI